MIENPIVFISYSWDNDAHKEWVLNLANKLRTNGIDVILDRYYLQPGVNVPYFVEDSIKKSNRIIIVLTPNYKQKAEERKGGVGREYSLINSSLAGGIVKNERIIPVLREGTPQESVVDFLRQYLYIDFSKDAEFDSNYEALIRELYKEPEIKIPELGKRPAFGRRKSSEVRENLTPIILPKRIPKEETRNLIINGKVRQALDKMEEYVEEGSDEYIAIGMLKRKFKNLKSKETMGIISSDEVSKTESQVAYTIFNLLNEM
ncbi:MAG: TIR domain-containing protein [Chitinophagales bacterium]